MTGPRANACMLVTARATAPSSSFRRTTSFKAIRIASHQTRRSFPVHISSTGKSGNGDRRVIRNSGEICCDGGGGEICCDGGGGGDGGDGYRVDIGAGGGGGGLDEWKGGAGVSNGREEVWWEWCVQWHGDA